MVPPVRGDVLVDGARPLVPDGLRVAVRAHGRVHRLPDVPLLARAAVRAEDELEPVHLLERRGDVPEIIPHPGPRRRLPGRVRAIGVLFVVDVDDGVRPEVDGIGARDVGAVVVVRIEHLDRHRFPSARRAPVRGARPTRAEGAVLLLEIGDELVLDGVAVGAEVRGVHGVRIVVVGIRVLDLDHDRPREARPSPVLEELMRLRLLDPVVALEVKAVLVHGLEVRIRRLFAEALDGFGEVPVEDHERVARVRVVLEAERKEDVRAEKNVAPPELRQALAPDALVLDPLRGRRLGNGRDHLVERDGDRFGPGGIDLDALRRAVQVAGREVPVLTLAAVHRQFHGMAVGAVEGLVLVEDGLHEIRAFRNRGETLQRVPEDGRVERDLAARTPHVHVDPEDLLRLEPDADLFARLLRSVLRDDQEKAPV